jgi:hypothetical protein
MQARLCEGRSSDHTTLKRELQALRQVQVTSAPAFSLLCLSGLQPFTLRELSFTGPHSGVRILLCLCAMDAYLHSLDTAVRNQGYYANSQ